MSKTTKPKLPVIKPKISPSDGDPVPPDPSHPRP